MYEHCRRFTPKPPRLEAGPFCMLHFFRDVNSPDKNALNPWPRISPEFECAQAPNSHILNSYCILLLGLILKFLLLCSIFLVFLPFFLSFFS